MRARTGLALLLSAALLIGCGSDDGDDSSADRETTTTAPDGSSASSDPGTDADTDAGDEGETTASSAPDDGGAPAAWPADVALPTAVDPSGAVIPDSLDETADPDPGPVILFTFVQGEGTALQSAYTGVGTWAETFPPYPSGTPCVKDDASAAALGGGGFACDALLPDGRLMQLSTSLVDGRMSLDVLIKEP